MKTTEATDHSLLIKEALEGLDYAILLCDPRGAIVVANDAAMEMLEQGDGLSVRSGQLCIEDPKPRQEFRAILQCACAADEQDAILVPRPSGFPSYQVVLKRVRAPFEGAFSDYPSLWSVVISDPARPSARRIRTITRLYQLTPAEVRLSDHLISGETLHEIAREIGVKISTVRSQLSGLFAKTGTRRQAELVRLFSSAPAMR